MNEQKYFHKVIMPLASVVLGIAYSVWLYSKSTVSDINHLYGIIGVILGLYICSHPSANLVEWLFYRQGIHSPFSLKQSFILWLLFNMLVLLMGGVEKELKYFFVYAKPNKTMVRAKLKNQ